MRNLFPWARVKIACLLWIVSVFDKCLYAEKYLFRFSGQFYYLLGLQEEIFSFLRDLRKRKAFDMKGLKRILSQEMNHFSDYELIGLTLAYLGAQGKEFLMSENEIESVRNNLEKYLQQILYNNTQLSQELNCKRIGDECYAYVLIDRFLSFFKSNEDAPLEVVGEFLYQQPARKLSLPF